MTEPDSFEQWLSDILLEMASYYVEHDSTKRDRVHDKYHVAAAILAAHRLEVERAVLAELEHLSEYSHGTNLMAPGHYIDLRIKKLKAALRVSEAVEGESHD